MTESSSGIYRIEAGFLIVKTFFALYRDYVGGYNLTHDHYAVPRIDRSPETYAIKYRGLDRDALSESECSTKLAQVRVADLKKPQKCIDGFLFAYNDALDIMGCLDNKQDYEIIWTRISRSDQVPPKDFVSVGFEPTYFEGDHFAAQCDCLSFPRWHGSDKDATLFQKYYQQLNPHGLFESPREATEFLNYYLTSDWTEHGEYVVAEVFIKEP